MRFSFFFVCNEIGLHRSNRQQISYVGLPYCRAEMYAGRVVISPLMSHGKYADETDGRTDGRTPDRYISVTITLAFR